jgi:dipeptidyl aminopeptidase/acylaminoacyl peptidase
LKLKLLALVTALLVYTPLAASQPIARTPIPADVMAREPALRDMVLSPDGAHLAAITSLDGAERAISVWRTAAPNVAPVRFGVGGAAARNDVRLADVMWVSNDRLLVTLLQPVTIASGAEGRTFTALARLVSLDGSHVVEPLAQGGAHSSETEEFFNKFLSVSLLDRLPGDGAHILMLKRTLDSDFVYRVDVNTGAGQQVMRLSETEGILPIVDAQGRPRVKAFVEQRGGTWVQGVSIFNTGTNSWEEQSALTQAVRESRSITPYALDPANEDILIVGDTEGGNFQYLRGYSISGHAFTETMYADPQHDISGVLMDSPDGSPTKVIGFSYIADAERDFYSDPAYAALQQGIQSQLPGVQVHIGPKHGRYRIIVAESSTTPPFYLLMTDDATLAPLGSSLPGVNTAALAPTQFVSYRARDGLTIPAFLTLPVDWRAGDPPLPVMIQPHGGPWSHNDASWGGADMPVAQYYASRGFAVLQPQFRGSTGYGARLWRAGDRQWGLAMQDDLDDGLQWLADQHTGDPARAVIYGYSYGGFAAMAASVRPNSPYRCAISGAGVSSLQRLGTLWSENRIQRQAQGWTVAGFDPLEHAGDANIPILLYGGDHDQTVPLFHLQRFDSALRSAHKPHQTEIIPDMAHSGATWTPAHMRRQFELVDAFLHGACGIEF